MEKEITREKIELTVKKAILDKAEMACGVSCIDELKDDAILMEDYAFDSLDLVEMVMDIEKHLNVDLGDDIDFGERTSVRDVIEIVVKQAGTVHGFRIR